MLREEVVQSGEICAYRGRLFDFESCGLICVMVWIVIQSMQKSWKKGEVDIFVIWRKFRN